jgi:hypothetical protein
MDEIVDLREVLREEVNIDGVTVQVQRHLHVSSSSGNITKLVSCCCCIVS